MTRSPRELRPIRTYEVRIDGYGEATYSARSPSKARARAWRDFTSVWEWSFHEFLCRSSVRRVPDPPYFRRALIAGKLGTIIYSPHNGIRFMRDNSDEIFSAHESEIKPLESATVLESGE